MSAQVIQGTPVEELNATHRCDGCGAQAFVRVQMPFGELLFCGNHWKRSKVKLEGLAISIQDETHKLFAPRVFPDDE